MEKIIEEAKRNFENWFAQTIDLLSEKEYAGIPLLMISFPLFERYSASLFSDKYEALAHTFNLEPNQAKVLWQAFRNGLLHKASFNTDFVLDGDRILVSKCGVSESLKKAVQISQNTNGQWEIFISPSRFSKQVIRVILNRFEDFFKANEKTPPLPQTHVFSEQQFSGHDKNTQEKPLSDVLDKAKNNRSHLEDANVINTQNKYNGHSDTHN
jgi:hypothetical protein